VRASAGWRGRGVESIGDEFEDEVGSAGVVIVLVLVIGEGANEIGPIFVVFFLILLLLPFAFFPPLLSAAHGVPHGLNVHPPPSPALPHKW
jgi:hypothetical protein